MDLRQIEYFVALYEEGSVTRAARRLNVVQPAISMQLAKLEDELGQRLFSRMPRGMEPTSAGREAYEMLNPVLRDIAAAKDRIGALTGEVMGNVAIGVIASVSNNAFSECLISFHAKYPKASIRATNGFSEELRQMVARGELDLAIVNHSAKRSPAAAVELLAEDLFLIGAAGASLLKGPPLKLASLTRMDLVLPSRRHGLRGVIDDGLESAGIQVQPRMEFDDIAMIEDFVSRTNFVTLLPRIAVQRALKSGQLISRAVRPAISRRIVCVQDPRRPLSRAAELLLQELRAQLGASIKSNVS